MAAREGTLRDPASSSWFDPARHVTEEAAYVGPDNERILAFLHRPTSAPPTGAVLICSSLYEDLQVQYRREVLLARELAARGVAVVRFHYRGAGNSDPLTDDELHFDSLVADGCTAADWLTRRSGVAVAAVYGARFGALVAAALATRCHTAPLALVGPVLSGADYFRGMSRASRVVGLKSLDDAGGVAAGLAAQFAERGYADFVGNRVGRRSFDDLVERVLPADVGARDVLLVQVAAAETLSSQYGRWSTAVRGAGARVDIRLVHHREQWFVPEQWEPEDDVPETRALIGEVSDWLHRHCGGPS